MKNLTFLRKKQNTESRNASSWILTNWPILPDVFILVIFFFFCFHIKWQPFFSNCKKNIHGKNRSWNITFGISAHCQGFMMGWESCKLLMSSFHWITIRFSFYGWNFPIPMLSLCFFMHYASINHYPSKTANDLHTPQMFETM